MLSFLIIENNERAIFMIALIRANTRIGLELDNVKSYLFSADEKKILRPIIYD